MYLMQIVQGLQGTGPCGGAPERDVVAAMKKTGASETLAQLDIYQAIQSGALRRIYCYCR